MFTPRSRYMPLKKTSNHQLLSFSNHHLLSFSTFKVSTPQLLDLSWTFVTNTNIYPYYDMNTPPSTTTVTTTDDDFSIYYSFFQEDPSSFDMPISNTASNKRKPNSNGDEEDGDGQGRKRGGGSGGRKRNKKMAITKILTSLVALEEKEEEEEEETRGRGGDNTQEMMMVGLYSDTQEYYSDLDKSDTVRTNRARLAAAATATTAVAAEEEGDGAGSEAGGGQQQHHQHQRRLWVKDRSRAWWERCNNPNFPESEFKAAFRMGKGTFDRICEELGSAIAKEDTMLRAAIPVRQRVAVCIWRLATGEPLRLVSKRFGLGISTCHKLVLEVCSAIKTVLMPKFLQWPNDPESINNIKSRFESISGIPNIIGSMYTSHIPIIAPKISVAAYFNKRHTERNQKTSYSITVQGVVDPDGVFTDVCIGWPGSMPDEQVLEKSALYQRAAGGSLKNQWIVGGSSYPLMDWVLVPYLHQNLTWTQHAFNGKIGEVQRVAKESFVRLKGRWKCLQKRTDVKLQDLPVVLGACCVLHNVCETMKEEMDPELRFDLIDDDMVPENGLRSEVARKERDNIAHNLLHRGLAGTTFFG